MEAAQQYPGVDSRLSLRILTVSHLLADPTLAIPRYQRPYKWTVSHVRQLFDDLLMFRDKKRYRLGTIVFHEKDGVRNIVDGQQRTITLLLAVRALIQKKTLERRDLSDQLARLSKSGMIHQRFQSDTSKFNIHTNYREIERIVSQPSFTEDMVGFLLNKCEFVTIALSEESEAFQFFDSQNARGRDLEPHDLLKAFHLREFNRCDEEMKASTVADWESTETGELASLFAEYLYRIRTWSRGASARHFGKEDLQLFKGVNLDRASCDPFAEPLRIAHYFVDHYNGRYERKIIGDEIQFPFQLDQTVINGRRFFEMIGHYRGMVSKIAKNPDQVKTFALGSSLSPLAARIMKTINDYPGMHRDGDRYVRGMFDCLLIYYLDKFGDAEISSAIEKIFIWAYTIRLGKQVVRFATVDNYVRDTGMFQRIREAIDCRGFLRSPLQMIGRNPPGRTEKTQAIFHLFEEMSYHE